MKNRVRYTVEKVLNNTFYQLPKFLFGEEFETISNDAMVLYTRIQDRHELSVKNQWYNKNGEVFIIMTRKEMESMLKLSAPTVRKIVKELIDLELIEEVRQGLTKPNLIYLLECKNFSLRKEKDIPSKSEKKSTRESKEVTPINTNVNQTDFNNTDSINQTAADNQDNNDTIRLNDPVSIKKEISDRIELERLLDTYPQYIKEIKEIYGIMAETLLSNKKSIRIAKEEMPASVVKEAFAKIDYDRFLYALQGLTANNTKVKNIRAYILTTLYNAAETFAIHNTTYGNQETNFGFRNTPADNRIEFKTFDLDHFFKLAVARSMGT